MTAASRASANHVLIEFMLMMLDGSVYANALMPWGLPGPIRFLDDLPGRMSLIEAHIQGAPCDVLYSPKDRPGRLLRVESLVLARFCPASDGLCRWLTIDLDGLDHGEKGLRDPLHAVRCIAERASNAGLLDGVLVARSRRGNGAHVFLFPPTPCTLADGVAVVAALIADAYRAAAASVNEFCTQHAFQCGDGTIAKPGQAGAVELIPRSTVRPELGWPIALPAAGTYAAIGGGLIIDPFTAKPISLCSVPRADERHWQQYLVGAEAKLRRNRPVRLPPHTIRPADSPLERIDRRTREFLEGRVSEGKRSNSAFAAACNLFGVGVDQGEVRRLILDAAAACGLPAHEAKSAVASALRAVRRRGRT